MHNTRRLAVSKGVLSAPQTKGCQNCITAARGTFRCFSHCATVVSGCPRRADFCKSDISASSLALNAVGARRASSTPPKICSGAGRGRARNCKPPCICQCSGTRKKAARGSEPMVFIRRNTPRYAPSKMCCPLSKKPKPSVFPASVRALPPACRPASNRVTSACRAKVTAADSPAQPAPMTAIFGRGCGVFIIYSSNG
ncbi:Uncharacterised protein [Neisseria meningitidis]|nr:Uncharacterised protein [Neisseria meningitidis]